MKNAKNKRAIIVGIFICVGIAIFITTIFTIGGEKKSFSKKFPVKAIFTDINGLQEGDNIWFSGVKIGTVKKIDLQGNAKVEVTMNVDEKAKPFIKKDARVKISSDGFIGNKLLVIFEGTPNTQPVAENDVLQTVTMPSTEDLFTTLQANSQNLLAITGNFKEISKRINDGDGSVGALINDKTLSVKLNNTLENFRKASLGSQKAINDIQSFTAALNNPNHAVHQLITDTIMTDLLRSSIVQLREATYTASNFVNELEAASEKLNDATSPAGVLLNDQQTAEALKATILNLRSGSKKLDEDLEALQHNFLLRGYFKKKEKEEKKKD